MLRGEVAVRGNRCVVTPPLLLAPAHHERSADVVRLQQLGGMRHRDRGVAAPGCGKRRGEPEPKGGIARLALGLGDEGGDLGRRDGSGLRGGCTGPRERQRKEQ